MSLIISDRVVETTTTTGTGALTLAGAVTGYRAFSSKMSVGDTCYYTIEAIDTNGNPTGDWETGLGTYSAASTLTRTTVKDSSNSGSAVSFATGTKRVFLNLIAAQLQSLGGGSGTTPTVRAAAAQTFASAGTVNVTLPTGSQAGDDIIISWGTGFTANSPSGTYQYDGQTGGNWSGVIFKKNLTSTDITNGYVAVSASGGSYNASAVAVTFVGAVKVVDWLFWRNGGASTAVPGYSKRVLLGEMVLSSMVVRATGNCTIAGATTQLAAINGTNASGTIYSTSPTADTALETSFNTSAAPAGMYYGHLTVTS